MSDLRIGNDESARGRVSSHDARDVAVALLLAGVTALAWLGVARADAAMQMSHGPARLSLLDGATFTLEWGVMMTAMMLPSAAPMILFYGRVRGGSGNAGRTIPAELFAATYLVLWLLTGVPVYLASVAVERLADASPAFRAAMPYLAAGTLLAAGLYQLTPVKRACLRQCQAPHDFLIRRWRGGYSPSLRLAVLHAAYCIGCCWALMVVLVAAGAMSMAWVLAIALVVFAEKVLPLGGRTAGFTGIALLVAGLVLAARPELAAALRPHGMH